MLQRCVVYSLKSMCFKYTDYIRQLFISFSIYYVLCSKILRDWWGSQQIYTCSCDQFSISFSVIYIFSRFLILLFILYQERRNLACQCLRNTDISHILHIYLYKWWLYPICSLRKMCTRHTLKILWESIKTVFILIRIYTF